MEYTTLTDEQLDEARAAILTEQERRDNLAHIPEQVTELVAKYAEGGGDREALLKAVAEHG